jgi:hypothetical protein
MVWVYPAICPRIGIWGAREEKVDAALRKAWQQVQGIPFCYTVIEKLGKHLGITSDLHGASPLLPKTKTVFYKLMGIMMVK